MPLLQVTITKPYHYEYFELGFHPILLV
jgi:hypothetical protein